MPRLFLCLCLVCVCLAPAQSFEVADIHTSPKSSNPFFSGAFVRGGRYELHHATMVDMISTAYGIKADNVWGGPIWLEDDMLDVIAKAPGGSKPEALKP